MTTQLTKRPSAEVGFHGDHSGEAEIIAEKQPHLEKVCRAMATPMVKDVDDHALAKTCDKLYQEAHLLISRERKHDEWKLFSQTMLQRLREDHPTTRIGEIGVATKEGVLASEQHIKITAQAVLGWLKKFQQSDIKKLYTKEWRAIRQKQREKQAAEEMQRKAESVDFGKQTYHQLKERFQKGEEIYDIKGIAYGYAVKQGLIKLTEKEKEKIKQQALNRIKENAGKKRSERTIGLKDYLRRAAGDVGEAEIQSTCKTISLEGLFKKLNEKEKQ